MTTLLKRKSIKTSKKKNLVTYDMELKIGKIAKAHTQKSCFWTWCVLHERGRYALFIKP